MKPKKSQKKAMGLNAISMLMQQQAKDNPPIFAHPDEFNPDPAIKGLLKSMNFEFNILRHPAVMFSPGMPILKIVHK